MFPYMPVYNLSQLLKALYNQGKHYTLEEYEDDTEVVTYFNDNLLRANNLIEAVSSNILGLIQDGWGIGVDGFDLNTHYDKLLDYIKLKELLERIKKEEK